MNFFSRFFKRTQPLSAPPIWPNSSVWGALVHETIVVTEDGPRFLRTVQCGDLALPSGRLVACDPFVCLSPTDTPFILTPRGKFPVVVTLADVSEKQDRSHIREAYASIIFSPAAEAYRKAIPLAKAGQKRIELKDDEFVGFCVDAGTACFVDESVVGPCMPDPETWYESLFENENANSWFRQMDDSTHIRSGIANIALPLAKNGENLILFHSGWGDGHYPIVGSYDSTDHLIAAHIDFFVINEGPSGKMG